MKFNSGDLVIKSTGGNKMRIISCNGNMCDCGWITESYHEKTFDEKDLIPLSQFDSVLLTEKRDDLLNQILKDNS
jgi:uncharacterized protein YodC (DUF2158 family)